jgi:transketolase
MSEQTDLDQICINTLRSLSIDQVEKAHSGHPGTPMGAAPTVFCLWQHFLRYDPDNPEWPNRDRFILSAGHASALLYSLLHLAGVKGTSPSYEGEDRLAVTMDDLKTFRRQAAVVPAIRNMDGLQGWKRLRDRWARVLGSASAWR